MKYTFIIILILFVVGCKEKPLTTVYRTVYNMPDTLGGYVKRHEQWGHHDTVKGIFTIQDSFYYEVIKPEYLEGSVYLLDTTVSYIDNSYVSVYDTITRKFKRVDQYVNFNDSVNVTSNKQRLRRNAIQLMGEQKREARKKTHSLLYLDSPYYSGILHLSLDTFAAWPMSIRITDSSGKILAEKLDVGKSEINIYDTLGTINTLINALQRRN